MINAYSGVRSQTLCAPYSSLSIQNKETSVCYITMTSDNLAFTLQLDLQQKQLLASK
jgi:hypothetical protein